MIRPRVHVVYEHGSDQERRPFGSAYIRLLLPLTHPRVSAHFDVSYAPEYFGEDADFVIVDRLWRPDMSLPLARGLLKDIRRAGAEFIYTLDDDLLGLPLSEWLTDEKKDAIRYLVAEADRIWVTTQELSDRLSVDASTIDILPNAIDDRLALPLIQARAVQHRDLGDGLVIGYMGTFTHGEDFLMVLPAIKGILAEFGKNIKIQVLGVASNASTRFSFPGLEVVQIPGTQAEYTKFLPWFLETCRWDIAIAPLADTPFNRCKSDIKYLDYSLLGAAGLYSDVMAYRGVLHMETGYKVENRPEQWLAALRTLINDPHLRERLGLGARADLISHRTLDKNADQWLSALSVGSLPQSISSSHDARTVSQPESKVDPR